MEAAHTIEGAQHTQPRKTLDPRQKLRLQTAVREFEAVLMGYMLKSMRSSIPREAEGEEGYGRDLLEGMFDAELARHVSRGSTLGLGEMLYKEITGEDMPLLPMSAPVTTTPRTPARMVPTPGGPSLRQAADSAAAPASLRDGASLPAPAGREHAQSRERVEPGAPGGPSIAPPDTVRRRMDAFAPIINHAAETHGVDTSLLKAVIATESAGHPHARSPKQAKGLMQLIDSTAAAMGVQDVWDPAQNVNGGARYLSQLLDRFRGDLERAVASYNAGPGAVDKHNGIPPFKETQAYVGKVLQYRRYFEQLERTGSGDD